MAKDEICTLNFFRGHTAYLLGKFNTENFEKMRNLLLNRMSLKKTNAV